MYKMGTDFNACSLFNVKFSGHPQLKGAFFMGKTNQITLIFWNRSNLWIVFYVELVMMTKGIVTYSAILGLPAQKS